VDVYCPIVLNNQIVGQSNPSIQYQNYDLMREMARVYMRGKALRPETQPKEVVIWNGYAGLPPFRSTESNVMNLVFYSGCKCYTGLLLEPRRGEYRQHIL